MRYVVTSVATALLAGCGHYTTPEAIIGVPLASSGEFEAVRVALTERATKLGLVRYEEKLERRLVADGHTSTDFAKRTITFTAEQFSRPGMFVLLWQLSPRCLLISVHDNAPKWSETTLRAIDDISTSIASATAGRAVLLVEPSKDFDGSRDARGPDRPGELEELCIRMGLPDPRPKSAVHGAA